MKKNRTRNTVLNIIFAMLMQLATAVSGIILPRIIIPQYGSEINGLVSSITKFLSYISLLEAGIGSVFRASLYKPLATNDMSKVSGIINAQKDFYRKIGYIFIVYVIALIFAYPMIANTNVDNKTIILFIIVLSIGIFIEYFFSLPYLSLITADQMVRLTYICTILVTLINLGVTYFLATINTSIVTIKVCSCFIALLKPITYIVFVKTHYNLDKNAKPEQSALDQRWNGMVHHFAYFIHSNTDVALLTILVSTTSVSIYGVYYAVIVGIEKIITAISSGISSSFGNMLVSDDKEAINRTFSQFELIQSAVATILFSVTTVTIMPFMHIYTAKMTDANYIQPIFAYILILAEAFYCFRCIYSMVSFSGNRFKETQKGSVIECVVNILISVIFVMTMNTIEMKLAGIALGTASGMLFRLLYENWFVSRKILGRSPWKGTKIWLVSGLITAISIFLSRFINMNVNTLNEWFAYAFVVGIVVSVVGIIIYCTMYFHDVRSLIKRFIRRK